jgi:hypothetical protein
MLIGFSKRFTLGLLAVSALTVSACGGSTLDFTTTHGVSTRVGTTMEDCPALPANVTLTTASGDIVITSVCIRDDEGSYYASGLSDTSTWVPTVPAGHVYSVVYQFAAAYTPPSSKVPTAGTVYVARDPVDLDPSTGNGGAVVGCAPQPEDDPSNLVASTATLDGGTISQQITDVVATGEQVDAALDIGALFADDCESGGPCGGGFNVRFYVGSEPTVCPAAP